MEGILVRQWGKLDLALFRSELEALAGLHEDPDILARFERLHAKVQQRLT